jgi:protoheme IX farnesyltransferase
VVFVVLLVTSVGYYLGCDATFDPVAFLACLFGAGCLAGGACALNQVIERGLDGLMTRTAMRPLPDGRLRPSDALGFGLLLGVLGAGTLGLATTPLATLIGLATFFSYVLVYTPMKPKTPHALFVGAIPGALPPLIGWSAACGTLNFEAGVVFAILFVWQIPHFMAISWLYRDDYRAARFPMFTVRDSDDGRMTARLTVWSTVLLLLTSLAPVLVGHFSVVYLVGAVILGASFFFSVSGFVDEMQRDSARRVVRASLVYLPILFLLLVIDRF